MISALYKIYRRPSICSDSKLSGIKKNSSSRPKILYDFQMVDLCRSLLLQVDIQLHCLGLPVYFCAKKDYTVRLVVNQRRLCNLKMLRVKPAAQVESSLHKSDSSTVKPACRRNTCISKVERTSSGTLKRKKEVKTS